MNQKAQSWSIDLVLAVVIFGFIAVSITSFALLNEPDVDMLQREAQLIDSRLDVNVASCNATIQDGKINSTNIDCLYNLNYEDIKESFRVRGDFCIFIEDEEGSVILISNQTSVGKETLRIGGIPCNQ